MTTDLSSLCSVALSRRDWLRQTALGVAALALPDVSAGASGDSAAARPQKSIK